MQNWIIWFNLHRFEFIEKQHQEGSYEIIPVVATQEPLFSFLSKTQLVKLRSKAMRTGFWFKKLLRIDRALIDLTIMVADTVHSTILAKNLSTILGKLNGLRASNFSDSFREIGLQLANKLSLLAQQWGNRNARSWPSDSNFANFLAMMHTNRHKTYKT
jgi:hypothetical protein